jgi:tetratricopeptide (TPR) repeat protein
MRTVSSKQQVDCGRGTEELARMESAGNGSLYELWERSYEAEKAGQLTRALEIHETILSRIGTSYAAYLRAGRLHYRAGGYRRSLSFYVKALLLSPDEAVPRYGMMHCYVAMGDMKAASRILSSVEELHMPDYRCLAI